MIFFYSNYGVSGATQIPGNSSWVNGNISYAKLRDSHNSSACWVLTSNYILFNNLTTKHDREMGLSSLDLVKNATSFHINYNAKLSISEKLNFYIFGNISAMAYCIKVPLILGYLGDHSTLLRPYYNIIHFLNLFHKISIGNQTICNISTTT